MYAIDARPSSAVDSEREDSVPKSACMPFTNRSACSGRPRTGWPAASRARTLMTDCDAPSWVM